MAHDENLAERVRDHLGNEHEFREQKMFGGLSFLVQGNMAVAVGEGGMLVRVSADERAQVLASTAAEEMVMGERRMRGWVRIDGQHLQGEALIDWIDRGLAVALSLPPK